MKLDSSQGAVAFVVLVPALALAGWASMAAGHFAWQTLPIALLLWSVALALGTCLSAYVSSDEAAIDPIVALLLGTFCLQMVLLSGALLVRTSVATNWLLSAGLASWLLWRARKRRLWLRLRLAPEGYLGLLLVVAFTSLWSAQNLQGMVHLPDRVISVPWLDVFYHAAYISHFAHGSGLAVVTDPLNHSASLPPYHYGGYLIPSLLVRTAGVTSYVAAIGVFAPVGFFCTGLGAYAFGRLLLGPLAGLIAVVLCLGIPDPSFYLLHNRWVSYFFFQQIAGSGAFATALFALAWAYCLQGLAAGDRRPILLALVAGASVVFFKSQVFLCYSFGLLLVAMLGFPGVSIRGRAALGLGALGLFALGVLVVLPAIPGTPTFLLGTSGASANLSMALTAVGGHCQNCIGELSKSFPQLLAVGVPFVLVVYLGWVGPLCMLLFGSRRTRRGLAPGLRYFPWLVLSNFLLVALGLQANMSRGDPFELIHKTFVWPYLALHLWCGCALAGWVKTRPARMQVAIPWLLAVSLVGLMPWVYRSAHQLQNGFVYPGSQTATNHPVPRGLFEAAEFIRLHSPPSALVQPSFSDDRLVFMGLAERHSYGLLPTAGPQSLPAQYRQSAAEAEKLFGAESADALRGLARQLGVGYLLLGPERNPAWSTLLTPVFERLGFRVYCLDPSPR